MKKVVLVDIDDTLADTQVQILSYVNERSDKKFTMSDLTREFREERVKGYEEHVAKFLDTPEIVETVPAYPYAENCLQTLRGHGCEIHIASSRKEGLHRTTEQWLTLHKLDRYIDDIHPRFSKQRGRDFKAATARKIGAVAAFDDTLNVAEALADVGVTTYLMDKPWNRTEVLPDNIQRVEDLAAAVEMFCDYAQVRSNL